MDLPHRRLTPDFNFFIFFWRRHELLSTCRLPLLVCFLILCFFLWGIPQLQSGWSLSCDHGLDYAS